MLYSVFKIVYRNSWKNIEKQDLLAKKDEIKEENVIKEEHIFNYDKEELGFNIYYGSDEKRLKPTIFDIHGGGWGYGNKDSNDSFCYYLANRGFNVISFSYTLVFKAKMKDILSEIDSFLTFLYSKRKEYLLDFENLFLTGDSAGGQLVFLYSAILKNKELQDIYDIHSNFKINALCLNHAVCYIKNVVDIKKSKILTKIINTNVRKMLFGVNYRINKLYERSEPQEVLTSSFYPTLIITSLGDETYKDQSLRLIEEFKKFNLEVEVNNLNLKEANHIYNVYFPSLDYSKKTNDELLNFFKKNLKKN